MSYLKYTGTRNPKTGKCSITVTDLDTGSGWPLPPRLDIARKSPTGFEWGYGGSGPAQTALAILVSHLADEKNHEVVKAALGIQVMPPEDEWLGLELHEYLAVRYYQQFKARVISKLSQQHGWEMTEEDIERGIADTMRSNVVA